MKNPFNTKLKKAIAMSVASVLLLVLALILLISPIAKYLVEKYDTKFTGRQIEMNYAYVNPFTGFVHFDDVRIYEGGSDSLFLSMEGLSANFSMFKLFFNNYEISDVTLNEPKGFVVRDSAILNFVDLIERFSGDSLAKNKEPLHLSILNISVIEGEFYFKDDQVPIHYFVKRVNLNSSGFRWNSDTITTKVSLEGGKTKGDLKGSFTINYKTMNYRLNAVARKFDLEIIDQYLNELVNYGTFRASIDANVVASGNLRRREDIVAKGLVKIENMHFGKDSTEDYLAFKQLIIDVNELSPKNHKYLFDSIVLVQPYIKYEKYDYLDNFENMFGKKGANVKAVNNNPEKFNLIIEVVKYVKVLVKNFFRSSYKINKLEVREANLEYIDYSLSEKFSARAFPLNIRADSVDKTRARVHLQLNGNIQPYGKLGLHLSINPKDSSDFDLDYKLQKVPLAMMNPYIIRYTSYPMNRGTLEVSGSWHVRNGEIASNNHILILDPRMNERDQNVASNRIPLRLIMYFTRERGNVMDYNIPISGDLKDPKFHFRDVIVDALENTFVKPATAVYRSEVKDNENDIENALTLKWNRRQTELLSDQQSFLKELSDILKDDPSLSISVYPHPYIEKEKETILLFEAKKKYFLSTAKRSSPVLSEDDSLTIDQMSNKDTLFVQYLNAQVKDPLLFTIQDKSRVLVHADFVNKQFNKLSRARHTRFLSYFKEGSVSGRVKMHPSHSKVPYNGLSYYHIVYNGTVPAKLLKASQRMNEMNNKPPRKQFRKQREQNKSS